MGFEFFSMIFSRFIKPVRSITINEVNNILNPPKIRSIIKKNKSIDDFMKHQLPWIL